MPQPGRRNALKLLSGGFVLASFPWELTSANSPKTTAGQSFGDGTIGLLFDETMRTSVYWRGQALTPFQDSERLLLKDGKRPAFTLTDNSSETLADPKHGPCARHRLTGSSARGLEKTVDLTFFEQFPGLAVLQVHYRNNSSTPLDVAGRDVQARER